MRLINPDNTETIIEINIEKGSRVVSNIPGPPGPQGIPATSENIYMSNSADVDMTHAVAGNFLRWNGSVFVVTNMVLDDALDVVAPSPLPGEALMWNGQVWVPGSVTGATGFYILKTGDSMTGTLDMTNHKIIGVAEPTAPADAATKNYVDALPRVFNGFGLPTDTVPVADNGDYYIDKTNNLMYGPRGPVPFGAWTLTANATPAAGQFSILAPEKIRVHFTNLAATNVRTLINAYFKPNADLRFTAPAAFSALDTIDTVTFSGGTNWTYAEVTFFGGSFIGLTAGTPLTIDLETQHTPQSLICWPTTVDIHYSKSSYIPGYGKPDLEVDPDADYSTFVDGGILYGPKTQIVYGGWGYTTNATPGATQFTVNAPDTIYIHRTAYISQDQAPILERYLKPGNSIKFHSLTSGDFVTKIYSAYGMVDVNAPTTGWQYARIRVNPAPPVGRWTAADNNVTISYWDETTGDIHWPETIELGKQRKMKTVGGTTYTPTAADENYYIICQFTGAPGSIVFAQESTTVNIPMGFMLNFVWQSGTQPIFTDAVNSFVIGTPGKKLRATYSVCTAVKYGFNTWLVYGDLSA